RYLGEDAYLHWVGRIQSTPSAGPNRKQGGKRARTVDLHRDRDVSRCGPDSDFLALPRRPGGYGGDPQWDDRRVQLDSDRGPGSGLVLHHGPGGGQRKSAAQRGRGDHDRGERSERGTGARSDRKQGGVRCGFTLYVYRDGHRYGRSGKRLDVLARPRCSVGGDDQRVDRRLQLDAFLARELPGDYSRDGQRHATV